MDNKRKICVSSLTKQSILTMLVNFISTIPDGKELEIEFESRDEDGKTFIHFDATTDSVNPDVQKIVTLEKGNLNIKVNQSDKLKSDDV